MTDDLCIENTHAHYFIESSIPSLDAHGIVYMYNVRVLHVHVYMHTHVQYIMYMCVLYNIRLIPRSATCTCI